VTEEMMVDWVRMLMIMMSIITMMIMLTMSMIMLMIYTRLVILPLNVKDKGKATDECTIN
jgi:hypothetical protein